MAIAETDTVAWPQDSTRVNVNDPIELLFWVSRFHVSEGKLKRVVREVGPNFKDVAEYLDCARRPRWFADDQRSR
jgi:hypothetical protein